MRSRSVLALSLGALVLTGCQFRGIPAHGGGKRFLREQEVISRSAQASLGTTDWSVLKDKAVRVFIHAVSDDGGGNQSGGRLGLGALFDAGSSGSAGGVDMAGAAGVAASNTLAYGSHAVASNADVEYLKGLVIAKVYRAGGRLTSAADSTYSGDVHVMVHVLGTDKWTDSYVIAWRESLRGKVDMNAYYVGKNGGFSELPCAGGKSHIYREMYILGFTAEEGRTIPSDNN